MKSNTTETKEENQQTAPAPAPAAPKTRKKREAKTDTRVGKLRAQIREAALVDRAVSIIDELNTWGLTEVAEHVRSRANFADSHLQIILKTPQH